jgi:hypothetical protein
MSTTNTINKVCKDGVCETTTNSTSSPATTKDCVEGYQTTGTCTSGKNIQTWVISQQPTKDGKPCATPTPTQKPVDCTDCVSEWTQWSECKDGQQTRTYKTVKEPTNGGKACEIKTENKSCGNSWWQIALFIIFVIILLIFLLIVYPSGAIKVAGALT